MITAAILAVLVAIAQGTTIPASTTPNITASSNTSFHGFQWYGPSKGVNITLYGYAHEIRDQLKALDPNWLPAERSEVENRSYQPVSYIHHCHICHFCASVLLEVIDG